MEKSTNNLTSFAHHLTSQYGRPGKEQGKIGPHAAVISGKMRDN